jgi:hypothetical protein
MLASNSSHDIYLEIGQKKVFAVTVDWPGWCRAGRDETVATEELLAAAPRYAGIAQDAGLELPVPAAAPGFHIVARLGGNATTDFGAPDGQLPGDREIIEAAELARLQRILQACWRAFDRAVQKGSGRELQKGPRGGGRDLMKIVDHVVGAEESYLRTLGWKPTAVDGETILARKEQVRQEVLRGLAAAANGKLPQRGPRGGKRWPARFFVRRLAWHVVDHAWEIEDRII